MTCGHDSCATPVSRRHLLKAGSAVAGAGALLAAGGARGQTAAEPVGPGIANAVSPATGDAKPTFGPSTDYLGMAKSAADWIIANRSEDKYGTFFPADPADPDRFFMAPTSADCFYCGMAGMIITFAELAKVTGEAKYREAAIAGAERLVKRWPLIAKEPIVPIDMRWGMVFGISGIGMALYQVGDMLNEPRFKAQLGPIADAIVAAARPNNAKGTWTEYAGYIADASTVLYLLHAAKILKDKRYLRTATQAGDRLIALATKQADGSLAWKGPHNPSLPHLEYPGFEMGTAGIAYTLASIYEQTGEKRFLDAAKQGAAYLSSLAVSSGRASLVPYALPDHSDIFYLGFCHGAAGHTRTFYKLHALTGDRQYLEWTNRIAAGILAAGAPELESPGMWNTVTQCCGTAAHVTLFLGLWSTFGNTAYLEEARRSARTISSRASNLDGKGDRWYMAWARVDPATVNGETGYMIGSAGIATALLHLHLANEGRYAVSLPWDNPYPTRA